MSDVVLPTRLMGMLGAKKILLTNAAGGANPSYKPGDFMMITDHITTGVPSPLIGPNMDELGTRFPDMSEVYSRRLQDVMQEIPQISIPMCRAAIASHAVLIPTASPPHLCASLTSAGVS